MDRIEQLFVIMVVAIFVVLIGAVIMLTIPGAGLLRPNHPTVSSKHATCHECGALLPDDVRRLHRA